MFFILLVFLKIQISLSTTLFLLLFLPSFFIIFKDYSNASTPIRYDISSPQSSGLVTVGCGMAPSPTCPPSTPTTSSQQAPPPTILSPCSTTSLAVCYIARRRKRVEKRSGLGERFITFSPIIQKFKTTSKGKMNT